MLEGRGTHDGAHANVNEDDAQRIRCWAMQMPWSFLKRKDQASGGVLTRSHDPLDRAVRKKATRAMEQISQSLGMITRWETTQTQGLMALLTIPVL